MIPRSKFVQNPDEAMMEPPPPPPPPPQQQVRALIYAAYRAGASVCLSVCLSVVGLFTH